MTGAEFARAVGARVAEFCWSYEARLPAYSYVPLEADLQRIRVMRSRLFNEVPSAEIFGAWLQATPELEVKMLLAEAVHEEMTHAQLLADRIGERGSEALRLPAGAGRNLDGKLRHQFDLETGEVSDFRTTVKVLE